MDIFDDFLVLLVTESEEGLGDEVDGQQDDRSHDADEEELALHAVVHGHAFDVTHCLENDAEEEAADCIARAPTTMAMVVPVRAGVDISGVSK